MVAAIANILKQQIGNLPWLERYAGLVTAAAVPTFKTDKQGVPQKVTDGRVSQFGGDMVFPVACDVDGVECWNNGTYKYLTPDSGVASVGFFVDNGGATFSKIVGPKAGTLEMRFDLKFLCWLNVQHLGLNDCNASALIVPGLIARLYDRPATHDTLRNIRVTNTRQLIKQPSMFSPFSFAKSGESRALFLFPHDYFGLQIQGTFEIGRNCLPVLPGILAAENCVGQ